MHVCQRLLVVKGVRVLKVSIPTYIDVDEHEVRLLLAVELYREGKLTLKQAAELAGLCVEDFMRAHEEESEHN